jgi:hypothetical protein
MGKENYFMDYYFELKAYCIFYGRKNQPNASGWIALFTLFDRMTSMCSDYWSFSLFIYKLDTYLKS